MKMVIRKALHLKFRNKQWEPPRDIDGFKEDGTDLLFSTKNLEVARFTAGQFEKMEGRRSRHHRTLRSIVTGVEGAALAGFRYSELKLGIGSPSG